MSINSKQISTNITHTGILFKKSSISSEEPDILKVSITGVNAIPKRNEE